MDKTRARVLSVAAPVGFAVAGNAFVGDAATRWYPRLRRSRLVPPIWTLIPVGVAYYVMCGVLLYRLLGSIVPGPARGRTLVLLLAMMGANEGWNVLFFGRKDLRASFVGILGFIGPTLGLYRALRRVDHRSATILLPYLAWLADDAVWAEELRRLNP